MKNIKLYNMIFPLWMLLFFPPLILVTLVGNYIIDYIILMICFHAYKVSDVGVTRKEFCKQNITVVWVFGLIADVIGAGILFIVSYLGELPIEIGTAVRYNPFDNNIGLIIVISAMLIASIFIFIFNYNFSFKEQITDKKLKFKIALTLAIITIPWTFLLPTPTDWFL